MAKGEARSHGFVSCLIPIIPVQNMEDSLAFYRDRLDFEVSWVWEDGGYAALRCGAVELHLDLQLRFEPYRAHSYLFVDDADERYALLRSRGVEIVREIESKPWGVREFTILDNNGHRFRIAQSLEEHDENHSGDVRSYPLGQ